MKNKIYRLIPALSIFLICLIIQTLHIELHIELHCEYYHNLLYIFNHANIFHFMLNSIALFQFQPRIKTCIIAYLCAVAASLFPFALMSMPTCGLSGFLMACYARRYYSWKQNPIRLILANAVLAFIPGCNWKIHLISFALGYAYYLIQHKLK